MQDYRSTISAHISSEDAFNRIARVSEWWTQHVSGTAQKVGDTFKVDWGQTWVAFEIAQSVPFERTIWRVTDCHLHWLKDKSEWKGTELVWDVKSDKGTTIVTLTHAGLTPAVECFGACEAGWNFYFGKSLAQFLTQGLGLPDKQFAQ